MSQLERLHNTRVDHLTQRRRRSFALRLQFKYGSLIPLLVLTAGLFAYPVAQLVRMAFSTGTSSGAGLSWKWSGLANARQFVDDSQALAAISHTVVIVACSSVLQILLGLTLAVLIVSRENWVTKLVRNVVVWPAVIAPVAIGVIWWLILNPQLGLLNQVLKQIGLPAQTWLGSPQSAVAVIIFVDVWHWVPLTFLIILAGLSGIDPELYEAANIDGADTWQRFKSVTLPLIVPTLVVATVIRVVLGLKIFDVIYVLTGGGPGNATDVISSYIQRVFFQEFRLGYGAFIGLVVMTAMLVLLLGTALGRGLMRRRLGRT